MTLKTIYWVLQEGSTVDKSLSWTSLHYLHGNLWKPVFWYNTNLRWTWVYSDMSLFRWPACFITWTTAQKEMQMGYPQVGWYLPFNERNCFVTLYFYQIVTTSVHPSVTVTLFRWLCPRLNTKYMLDFVLNDCQELKVKIISLGFIFLQELNIGV
jgi:hypothetical protein